jgi:hypothetical protein
MNDDGIAGGSAVTGRLLHWMLISHGGMLAAENQELCLQSDHIIHAAVV